jgi:type II secretory pathway pseudopilin PulG
MMVVVAVAGILCTIAVVAYTKVFRKVRSTEVVTMFGELKTREQQYWAEFGRYLPLCRAPSGAQWKDCPEADNQYWPDPLPGSGQAMPASSLPARWQTLRPKIESASLYCQYEVVAGLAGDAEGMGPRGLEMFPTAPTRNWFYLLARCNWDNDASINAEYWQRDDWAELNKENEGR